MAALTDYAENKLIDFLLRGQTLTAPTTWYMALYTVAPNDAGGGTEVSGGSYARVAIVSSLSNWAATNGAGTTTVSSGSSGTTSNNNSITFPAPTASWGTAVAWGLFDASTGGNLWIYAALTANKTVNNGDPAPYFAAAGATWQIDN